MRLGWVKQMSCVKTGARGVFYTYQDEYTGTAAGQGAMHSGEKIKIWSGTNVLEYLRGDTGERIAYLPCDGGHIDGLNTHPPFMLTLVFMTFA